MDLFNALFIDFHAASCCALLVNFPTRDSHIVKLLTYLSFKALKRIFPFQTSISVLWAVPVWKVITEAVKY